jgi:hypothetical protein
LCYFNFNISKNDLDRDSNLVNTGVKLTLRSSSVSDIDEAGLCSVNARSQYPLPCLKTFVVSVRQTRQMLG